ncbi:MAG: hypothetical protein V4525_13720 [Pseudomonadota bacterium]
MTQLFDITLFSFTLIAAVAAYNVLVGNKSKKTAQLPISTKFLAKQTFGEILSTMLQLLGLKQEKSAHLCKNRLDECCSHRNAPRRIIHKE